MAVVMPIAVADGLAGSAIALELCNGRLLFATALHVIAKGGEMKIAVPPHGGDVSKPQAYPLATTPALLAEVIATDPMADIAILAAPAPDTVVLPTLRFGDGHAAGVGTDVIVLGYPFAPIGSFLETWHRGHITALARREAGPGVFIHEIVLSTPSYPGSSGSAVVSAVDGRLLGLVRGALAPPEVLKIGNIPLGTDSSITFAVNGALVGAIAAEARDIVGGAP